MTEHPAQHTVEFWIPAGRALPARLVDGSIDGDVAEVTIELDQEEWEMADMTMLFHLQWNDRNPGEIVEGNGVRVRMRLTPGLVATMRDVAGDDADVVGALAGLDREHELRSTLSWYATEVTEEVPLPPSLADRGEVRSGFTTRWHDTWPPAA